MSFDLFTLDCLTVCPAEFTRMEEAQDKAHALWVRRVDGDPGVTEAEVTAAQHDAKEAEKQARAAYAKVRTSG